MNHEANGSSHYLESATLLYSPRRPGDFRPFEVHWLRVHLELNEIAQRHLKTGEDGQKTWNEKAALEEMRDWINQNYKTDMQIEHVDELRDDLATTYLQKKTERSRRIDSMQGLPTSTTDSTPSD